MSSLLSRLKKPFLLSAACISLGLGVLSYASDEKITGEQIVSAKSSGFFSFDLLGQDRVRIDAAMTADLQNGKLDKITFRDSAAMQTFYSNREGRPFWVGNAERIDAVVKVLDNAWTHALNPQNYHVAEIKDLINADTPEDKARLELLLTDAVIRYGHDMTGMHLPIGVTQQDPQFWRKALEPSAILDDLGSSDTPDVYLAGLAPHDSLYMRLREELMALINNPDRAGDAYVPMSFSNFTLRPGDISRDVPKLRGRLGLTYDPANGPERKYDDDLAAAVMSFQRQNGLEADGDIGPKTLALLNRSSTEKINQLIANMERLRWLDESKPDRYILVNIPSQTLWAVDHGAIALQMPVIVGRPERPTKAFHTMITGVRFNPKWTVPPTIKANDMLNHLQEDPTYLDQKGIELSAMVDGHRETLDPASIDWAQMTKADMAHLHMVQGAGDNNALGKVRVLMDNPYDIYLHDTSSPELFSKHERTLSSGCIRLSNPEAVARFILTDNANWSDQRMKSIIASGRTTEITAAQQIPVFIVYQTVWLDDAGRLVYGPDVYKQDRALVNAMNTVKAYHIPEPSKTRMASLSPALPVH
jgi:murein L,D-transpeptidase YcbB/YkuD